MTATATTTNTPATATTNTGANAALAATLTDTSVATGADGADGANAGAALAGANAGGNTFVDTGEEFMVNITATFVPSPDVHESLRGVEYTARRDCELGLMQIADDDGLIIPAADSMSTTQHTTVAVMSKLVNETHTNLARKDDADAK